MPARPSSRDQLLATATRLFYEDGITATGVDTVVREAGVSKPTLYAHFGSKADLVAAVLQARHATRSAELQAWVLREEDPRRRPLAVLAELGAWYEAEGARGCAFLNAAAELVGADDAGRLAVQAEKAWLQGFLADLVRGAGLRDADRIASQLLLLVDGIGARVLVQGPAAAAAAVEDATRVAQLLLDAAGDPA